MHIQKKKMLILNLSQLSQLNLLHIHSRIHKVRAKVHKPHQIHKRTHSNQIINYAQLNHLKETLQKNIIQIVINKMMLHKIIHNKIHHQTILTLQNHNKAHHQTTLTLQNHNKNAKLHHNRSLEQLRMLKHQKQLQHLWKIRRR